MNEEGSNCKRNCACVCPGDTCDVIDLCNDNDFLKLKEERCN